MNIAILGAGWLGTELAHILKNNKYKIRVSVTTEEKKQHLQAMGLNAFAVNISSSGILGELDFFKDVDVLISTLTPQPITVFNFLVNEIKKHAIKNVIVCSSTGIYQDCEGVVIESSVLKLDIPKVQLLKCIEDVFLINDNFDATVLRLGGLIGKERHPVKHLVKKEAIADGNEPVNILYQKTFINTIISLLKNTLPNTVFNLVENDHRTREAFYTTAAKEYNFVLPPFTHNNTPKKRIVSTEKLNVFLQRNEKKTR